jgi:hypothetical protein
MGDDATNAFLMNTSNNGNGISDPNDEDYGKYHFVAEDPDSLSEQLLAFRNLNLYRACCSCIKNYKRRIYIYGIL